MLSVDTSGLADSLKKAEQEIQRRLLGMVHKFTTNFTEVAVRKTPIGDDSEQGFKSWYDTRTPPLPQSAGMSRANWQVMDTDDFVVIYGTSQDLPKADVDSYFGSFYKLGETYYLGNATPYIRMLENNHSHQTEGQGIKQPVINEVLNIYQYRLDDYYKQS